MIRKIYLDMVRQRLAGGNIAFPVKAALMYLFTHLSRITGKPLCGPVLGTLVVTYRCNFRCVMCDLPSKTERQGKEDITEKNTSEMMAIIDQLSALGVMGIGFTGGEPMLRHDIIKLLDYSKKKGLLTHLNTNGSLLSDDIILKLMDTGVDSINISLDAADASTHDSTRYSPGAWDQATRAASEIVRLRNKGKGKPRLKLVMVVGSQNVQEIPDMVDLAYSLGVEYLEYIPEQPFRETREERSLVEMDKLAKRSISLLQDAVKSARGRVKIENSSRMLKLFGPAIRGEPSPLKCFAGYNSITVDCYGQVFPCLPWANWERNKSSIQGGDLDSLWNSQDYQTVRNEVGRCQECTLNCQAELNLLFQPFRNIQ